jgi:hypothetical protein
MNVSVLSHAERSCFIKKTISARITFRFELDGPGFEYRQEKNVFSSPNCPDKLWAHSASYPMATELISRRDVDHSSSSSA